MFLQSLQTKYIGYLNVTTGQIIDHLYNQYAQILAVYLQDNGVALKTADDPNIPIETLFNQVENTVDFSAEVNNPYSTEKVITTAYQLIYTTGMLLNDWKIRKHHPEAYK